MDYEARIVKLETEQATIKEELRRLNDNLDALREHSDQQIKEFRTYVDGRFERMEGKIDELRKELLVMTRWVAGVSIFNIVAILGLALKFAAA